MQRATYSSANTEFALNLFRAGFAASANAEDAAKRHVVQVSPFSIRRALSMAGLGARGKTRKVILDGLCLPQGVDFTKVNEDNLAFVRRLIAAEAESEAPTEILVANALWLKKDDDPEGYQFHQAFIDANKKYFDALVRRIKFDKKALDEINAWCAKATKDKIDKILNELPDGCRAVLTDALYMKTPAKHRFYKGNDLQHDFIGLDGKPNPLTFMMQHGDFRHLEDAGLQVLEFPFGENGVYNFYLLLPEDHESLAKVVNSLTVKRWAELKGNLEDASGYFRIAQNEQEFDTDVKDILADELGMGLAFDDAADFLDMCTKPLKIGAVKHKTYTKFTRKGFEGAAVTALLMMECLGVAVGPSRTFDVTADRPYAWFVEGGDEILFAGTTTLPVKPKDADQADADEEKEENENQ